MLKYSSVTRMASTVLLVLNQLQKFSLSVRTIYEGNAADGSSADNVGIHCLFKQIPS